MKKSSKKKTSVEESVIETEQIAQPNITSEASEPKKLGRPVVEGSKRQIAMQERERKLANGELKRGRKANPNSKRQAHLAHLADMKAAGLLTGKKGRPVNPNSDHQKTLAEKQARIIANGGIPVGPGRPKVVKAESTDETVDVN